MCVNKKINHTHNLLSGEFNIRNVALPVSHSFPTLKIQSHWPRSTVWGMNLNEQSPVSLLNAIEYLKHVQFILFHTVNYERANLHV